MNVEQEKEIMQRLTDLENRMILLIAEQYKRIKFVEQENEDLKVQLKHTKKKGLFLSD